MKPIRIRRNRLFILILHRSLPSQSVLDPSYIEELIEGQNIGRGFGRAQDTGLVAAGYGALGQFGLKSSIGGGGGWIHFTFLSGRGAIEGIEGVARIAWITRIARVAGVTGIAGVAGIARVARVTGVTRVARIATATATATAPLIPAIGPGIVRRHPWTLRWRRRRWLRIAGPGITRGRWWWWCRNILTRMLALL